MLEPLLVTHLYLPVSLVEMLWIVKTCLWSVTLPQTGNLTLSNSNVTLAFGFVVLQSIVRSVAPIISMITGLKLGQPVALMGKPVKKKKKNVHKKKQN